MEILREGQLGATKDSFPLFRCPLCHESGLIDEDQFHGRVSIQCPAGVCPYHDTKDWSRE